MHSFPPQLSPEYVLLNPNLSYPPPPFFKTMLSVGRLKLHPDAERINLLLNQASPIILTGLISLVIFHGYLLIKESNAGPDLFSTDIPNTPILLTRQNPHSPPPSPS